MEDFSAPVRARQSALPWVIVALAVLVAGSSIIWMNNKIGALEAAKAPAQELNVDETRQALAALQKRFDEIQSGQTSLSGQVSELKGQVAKEQGERKLLSDQLGSLSERVDALSSSSADANAGSQQPQRNRRSKR